MFIQAYKEIKAKQIKSKADKVKSSTLTACSHVYFFKGIVFIWLKLDDYYVLDVSDILRLHA